MAVAIKSQTICIVSVAILTVSAISLVRNIWINDEKIARVRWFDSNINGVGVNSLLKSQWKIFFVKILF